MGYQIRTMVFGIAPYDLFLVDVHTLTLEVVKVVAYLAQ